MEEGFKKKGDKEIPKNRYFDSNKAFFERAAEKLDPFRKLTEKSGYDPMLHDIMKIEASDTCGYFTLVRGKETPKASESYPVSYNQDSWDFKRECDRAYNSIKKKLERGLD